MMIKEGTGNGTLVKNEQEFWIKAPPPLPDPVLLQPHKYYSGTCMKWHHIQRSPCIMQLVVKVLNLFLLKHCNFHLCPVVTSMK